jgi:hypothetical protein
MIDLLQLLAGVIWWFRLLQRSPGRAVTVLITAVVAFVVIVVGLMRLVDRLYVVLLLALAVLVMAAVCLWANDTAPKSPREQSATPDKWAPPSAEEVQSVIGGSNRHRPNE